MSAMYCKLFKSIHNVPHIIFVVGNKHNNKHKSILFTALDLFQPQCSRTSVAQTFLEPCNYVQEGVTQANEC